MKKIVELIIIIKFLTLVSFANTMYEETDIHIYEGSKIQISDVKKILDFISKDKSKPYANSLKTNYYKIDEYGITKSKNKVKIQEFEALKYLNSKNIKNIPLVYGAFRYKKHYHVISSHFNGTYVDINSLKVKNIKKILDQLFELDRLFFYHWDLNPYNILFSENSNKICIIDFDAIYFIDNSGKMWEGLREIEPCSKTNECFINKINNEKDKIDLINPYADNVFLHIPSNINSFEYKFLGTIFPELLKNEKFDTLFCEYLKLKANYIKKRDNYYSKQLLNTKNKLVNENNFELALKIDKAISNVLKKETYKIKELEKIKMKIREESVYIYWRCTTHPQRSRENIKKLFVELRNEIKKIENAEIDNKDINLYLFSVKKWIEVWEPISLN